ncbi:M36 family metallopeptidase [Marinobacterium arenosum]|uniref:M36 family metallopeptidase n=1 Tax=Marinobacterium arenosum TaxID=2862496 RepID=UPI001C988519|nr:M36 family metallopeptidase [Marinobacterium arenosum]MBY4678184.1 M36 family metallopeptidase [Marinobacterium arenosum]
MFNPGKHKTLWLLSGGLLTALLGLAPSSTQAAPANANNPIQYLSGPQQGDPLGIAIRYLQQNHQALGLSRQDIADFMVSDHYSSSHNGVSHIHLRQRYRGIEVHNASLNINIAADGSVINLGNHFIANLETAINTTEPALPLGQAISAAARALGLDPAIGPISRNPISGKLVYQPVAKNLLRLAWDVEIYELDAQNWWTLRIDALTGTLLDRTNYVAHDNYRVFPEPVESPNHGSRFNMLDPADSIASSSGWLSGNCSRGNNVDAYLDTNASNSPTGGDSARACDAELDFSFPLDLSLSPDQYRPAAVTNLFYWNNLLHDIFYHYGFDEVGGNFQENNGGQGGSGSDSVMAEAQDGGGLNNANFATPPDGGNPRMQMFLWDQTTPMRDGDLDNGVIAHEYGHGISNRLTGGPGTTSCLSNTEQPGEGWSDYFGLWVTMTDSDQPQDRRGIGTYVLGEPTDGTGIRDYPYSTSMSIDPRTYNSIKSAAVPHGVGSVWAAMLWEMTWALIGEYYFDSDMKQGLGGNNIALQLVVDGLKLQPCSPGFVDARDAILLADLNNYGGAHQCLIWQAFAKRGLGYSADQGSSSSRTDGSEAFDLPPVCQQILAIISSASPSPVEAGQLLTYSLQIDNRTTDTLSNVTVSDTLPPYASYVEESADCGGSESGGVLTFPLGTMASGSSRNCSFQVMVSPSAGVRLLEDDMENGSALWTVSHGSGNVDWALGNDNPNSPSHAWFAEDIATSSDQYLSLASPLLLGDEALLRFWHHYDTEADWDGGVVEISADGGSWTDLGTLMFQNGYNSTINTNPASAISDRKAFSGNSGGYQQTLVDLAGYQGSQVRIRFRMATDGFVDGLGWYLDDLAILNRALLFNQACVTASGGDSDCSSLLTAIDPPPPVPAPQIQVSPTSLSATLMQDETSYQSLTIANSGSEQLIWDIYEDSDGNCSSISGTLSWAWVSPSSGNTAPSANSSVTVEFDANNLAAGQYSGALCVQSNDSDNTPVSVALSLTVNDPTATQQQQANGEIPGSGAVSGNYQNTWQDDGLYQQLQETHQGGKPSDRYDLLEHSWTFNLQNGSGLSFHANAWADAPSSDGDALLWYYSMDGSNWSWFHTLTATSSGNAINLPLPDLGQGTLHIKVKTSDQTPGNNSNDGLTVDYLMVTEGGSSTPEPTITMTLSGLDGSAATGRRNRWDASATATVIEQGTTNPVSGAQVTGSWSNGGSGSCTTNSSGQCSISKSNIKSNVSSVTFSVTNVSRGEDDYQASPCCSSVEIFAP